MTSLDLKEFTGLTKWSWPTNERIRSKWQEDKVAGEQWGGAASLLSYFTADCDQRLLITACNLVRSWSARPEALCQVCDTKISLLKVCFTGFWMITCWCVGTAIELTTNQCVTVNCWCPTPPNPNPAAQYVSSEWCGHSYQDSLVT